MMKFNIVKHKNHHRKLVSRALKKSFFNCGYRSLQKYYQLLRSNNNFSIVFFFSIVTYPLFEMDHKVDQKLFIDHEKGEFSFIYSNNDKHVIDLSGKLVYRPKRARTVYELDMKVTV